MWLITLILSIIYIIWLTNLINFGIRTATRIAVASEATALSVASIYHALSPEAKERARDFQRQIEESNAANAKVIAKARSERDYKIGIAVVALVLMVIMWAPGALTPSHCNRARSTIHADRLPAARPNTAARQASMTARAVSAGPLCITPTERRHSTIDPVGSPARRPTQRNPDDARPP